MKRKTPPQPQHQFTERERREFLYHTAAEMRAINDRADARVSNDTDPEDAGRTKVCEVHNAESQC